MASINDLGNIVANCPGCDGALSSFEWWHHPEGQFGVVARNVPPIGNAGARNRDYRLFRCTACGRGAFAEVMFSAGTSYPGRSPHLQDFYPSILERLPLPRAVPKGIASEFREAESCLGAKCNRAAAGMLRSVLDKILRANGYKVKNGTTLEQQIDMAGADGAITESRRLKAHDEIRVLGNDVLHDEWHQIEPEDVLAARHYAQRILEDFYDDRPAVLKLLRSKGRTPEEDRPLGTTTP